MFRKLFIDAFQSTKLYIESEINSLTKEELDKTSIDDWITYFLNKYKYQTIELLDKQPELKEGRSNYYKDEFSGTSYSQDTSIVKLAVAPNKNLPVLFEFQPSTYAMPAPQLTYSDGYITLSIATVDPHTLKTQLDLAKQNIGHYNTDIERSNNELPGFIKPLIEKRMETLKAKEERSIVIGKERGKSKITNN